MKALSLWQPWATLWLLDSPREKLHETRHWYWGYRGPLLIHAAKTRNADVKAALSDPMVQEAFRRHNFPISGLAFGALIGKLEIAGCRRTENSLGIGEGDKTFGNWDPGRYAIHGARPKLWAESVPWIGRQGPFDVPDEVLAAAGALPV